MSSSLACVQQFTPSKPVKRSLSTFVDMFCGIGGFHYAAKTYGMTCAFACDIDQAVHKAYSHNFGVKPHGDITCIQAEDIPDHDLFCAGFPCQPFSILGKQKGFNDMRGTLFFDIARILRAKMPKAIVLENVKQLATHER